jgi:RimJ/RimL family protein N-acetyltransferase
MLLPYCQSREESEKYLQELIAETTGAWLSIVRAIESQDSGNVIGLCGIVILHGSEQGEIGYLVRRDYWGRGIAAE